MVCSKCGHDNSSKPGKEMKEMKGKKPSMVIAIGVGKGKKMDGMKNKKK